MFLIPLGIFRLWKAPSSSYFVWVDEGKRWAMELICHSFVVARVHKHGEEGT